MSYWRWGLCPETFERASAVLGARFVAPALSKFRRPRRTGPPCLEAGPSGIKIGAVQGPLSTAKTLAAVEHARPVDELPHPIYMTHQAVRDPSPTGAANSTTASESRSTLMTLGCLATLKRLFITCIRLFETLTERQPIANLVSRLDAGGGEFNMTAEILFRWKAEACHRTVH